jgi:hypothetical protein
MPGGYPTNRLPDPYAAPSTTPPVTDEHVGPSHPHTAPTGRASGKLASFAAHDNTRRPHRALQLRPPHPASARPRADPRQDPASTGARRNNQRVRIGGVKMLVKRHVRVLEPRRVWMNFSVTEARPT